MPKGSAAEALYLDSAGKQAQAVVLREVRQPLLSAGARDKEAAGESPRHIGVNLVASTVPPTAAKSFATKAITLDNGASLGWYDGMLVEVPEHSSNGRKAQKEEEATPTQAGHVSTARAATAT